MIYQISKTYCDNHNLYDFNILKSSGRNLLDKTHEFDSSEIVYGLDNTMEIGHVNILIDNNSCLTPLNRASELNTSNTLVSYMYDSLLARIHNIVQKQKSIEVQCTSDMCNGLFGHHIQLPTVSFNNVINKVVNGCSEVSIANPQTLPPSSIIISTVMWCPPSSSSQAVVFYVVGGSRLYFPQQLRCCAHVGVRFVEEPVGECGDEGEYVSPNAHGGPLGNGSQGAREGCAPGHYGVPKGGRYRDPLAKLCGHGPNRGRGKLGRHRRLWRGGTGHGGSPGIGGGQGTGHHRPSAGNAASPHQDGGGAGMVGAGPVHWGKGRVVVGFFELEHGALFLLEGRPEFSPGDW